MAVISMFDPTDTRLKSAGCRVATSVTATERAALLRLADHVGTVMAELACELVARHDGSHVAFAAAVDGGDRWWWVRWSAKAREVVALDVCAGVGRPAGDDCLLPCDHPGPHSFELWASPIWCRSALRAGERAGRLVRSCSPGSPR